jgi:hypothetical protein
MKRIENECVGCTSLGMHCLGIGCPNREVLHYYCDECEDECDLYEYDGKELCIECIEKRLHKIT